MADVRLLIVVQFASILYGAVTTFGHAQGIISYHMATCGGQNCDSVCQTFQLSCARTGQSFPSDSALPIFQLLGIPCKTDNTTDYYRFEDSPNYYAEEGLWAGKCLGFKSIPSTIDCITANNTDVRRLCPCFNPLITTQPTNVTTTPSSQPLTHQTTTPPKTMSSSSSVETAPYTTEKPPSTTLTTPQSTSPKSPTTTKQTKTTNRDHTSSRENSTRSPQPQADGAARLDMVEKTTFIVAAVLGVALVVCVSALAFVVLNNRKRARDKTNGETDSEKLHVEYNTKEDKIEMREMIDGLTVETDAQDGLRYSQMEPGNTLALRNSAMEMELKTPVKEKSRNYENVEKATDNVLYASIPDEADPTFLEDSDPVYDKLVN